LYLILIKIVWKKTESPTSYPKIVTGTVDLKEIANDVYIGDPNNQSTPKTARLLL
jgi:hypothetical protein